MNVLTKYRKIIFVLILVLFAALFIIPTTRQAVFSQGCSGTVNTNCGSGCCLATNQVWKLPAVSSQACTWRESHCVENWIKNYTVSCPGSRERDCRTETWDQRRCE